MINHQSTSTVVTALRREDSAVVTSRDGYNRNRPMRESAKAPRSPQRPDSNWTLDADELDRYMSGQPAREPRFDPYGRSQSTGRTERTASQSIPQQPRYDDFQDDQPEEWNDADYAVDDEYGYDDYQEEPVAPQRRTPARQPRQSAQSRQREHEFEDDLYDDPYVMDDEDRPRRPQRAPQRPSRERAARPSANFTMPTFISDAAIVKDPMSLAIAGAGLISLLAMIIIVATQRDGLGETIFTHVNANGQPENIQSASAIWNLPLIAGMVSLISMILAWFLARWDSFLPRFLLGGALGVQFIVWVAVIAYLF